MLAEHLLKIKEEYKYLKKKEIQDLLIKTKKIKVAFKAIWLIEVLKIYLEK